MNFTGRLVFLGLFLFFSVAFGIYKDDEWISRRNTFYSFDTRGSPFWYTKEMDVDGNIIHENEIRDKNNDGGGICEVDSDCEGNGVCVNITGRRASEDCPDSEDNCFVCDCDDKYAGDFCEDERKSFIIAILLYVFTGLQGGGDYYLGYIAFGVVKTIFFVMIFIPCLGKVILIADVIWALVSLILCATGNLNDADGNSLYT